MSSMDRGQAGKDLRRGFVQLSGRGEGSAIQPPLHQIRQAAGELTVGHQGGHETRSMALDDAVGLDSPLDAVEPSGSWGLDGQREAVVGVCGAQLDRGLDVELGHHQDVSAQTRGQLLHAVCVGAPTGPLRGWDQPFGDHGELWPTHHAFTRPVGGGSERGRQRTVGTLHAHHSCQPGDQAGDDSRIRPVPMTNIGTGAVGGLGCLES